MAETLSKRLRDYCNIIDQLGHLPLASLLAEAATELEALRKRCEAVEAALQEAWPYIECDPIAEERGVTEQVREAIAEAQEPSHG